MQQYRTAAALVLGLLWACGSGDASGPAVPATIEVTPGRMEIVALGPPEALVALVRDRGGKVIEGAQLAWETSDPDVVLIDDRGMVTPVSNGSAEISVTSGAARGSVDVVVKATYLDVVVTGDGDPLRGVGILLVGPGAANAFRHTDESGRARFVDLGAGTHTLTLLEAPSDLTVARADMVEIRSREEHRVLLEGGFPLGVIRGRVHAWGKGLSAVTVRAIGKDTVAVQTDPMGLFDSGPLRRGIYDVRVGPDEQVRWGPSSEVTVLVPSGEALVDFHGRPTPAPEWANHRGWAGAGLRCHDGRRCLLLGPVDARSHW